MGSRGDVLVTGASSGIGRATVVRLSTLGYRVTALARTGVALEALAGETGCLPLELDLTDTEMMEEVLGHASYDILVNNAGTGAGMGPLTGASARDVDIQIDVNLRAPLHLTRLLLPGMVARGRGHVVSIGSIAGRYPFPGMAVYGGVKAAINQMAKALRLDLLGAGIRVTTIAPGRVETGIFATMLNGDAEAARDRFFEGYESLLPEDVAEAIAWAVAQPPRVNVGHIELTPTRQVPGGLSFARGKDGDNG
ncbi:MAG: SDR family NAD(P)-dependent oxidoreductase [Rhodospirillum sp.]|nr:SDR family NAD(P)-dependent oxidoreductase [Rhodospirillum sp.]MCF8489383.1 SDR family NAD(P)-dependent oxidoreductase [Rhodospirillum sp.]MCF8503186.1 SDR family NAD(P)-dependent oxidoreductase [Rhodospirillum sp.]